MIDRDKCNQCNHEGRKSTLQSTPMMILGVPIPNVPVLDETLQNLVDDALAPTRVTADCNCMPQCGCRAKVGMTTQKFLFDGEALIVQLQRLNYDVPKETLEFNRNANRSGQIGLPLAYRDNRRRVRIPNVLTVPFLDGLQKSSRNFSLCAAIEHSGSISKL